jgi:hypothetical protein
VNHGVAPAENFYWTISLSNKITNDFDAMAAEVDYAATAGFLVIPKPSTMWSRVGFARANPKNVTYRPVLDRLNRFESFGGVTKIL